MTLSRVIGIDPGKQGGIAWIDDDGPHAEKLTDKTDRDIWELIAGLEDGGAEDCQVFAMIERVRSTPQMGVRSTFTFGRGFGGLLMALTAAGIPFEEVWPTVWQRNLKCLTKGDKYVTKRRAQELFPSLKITHAIADALLIAEYARRVRMFN